MHNLFGDTHSVNVELDGQGGYRLLEPMHGDGADDMLRYVHIEPEELERAYRRKLLEANLPPINVDAVLMERVFWNLLENALKYSPESEPVEISVRQHEKRMEICVCDRGPGVPAAQVELIFDTFQRGRQESEIPGVGLGLSIARTIIEAHGGELCYFPRPGGGSCFKASLPLAQIPAFESASEMR